LTGDSTDILRAASRLGATSQRAYRILWGVDFQNFRPEGASSYRQELGFSPEHILFFSPRSYTQPYYNIDTVIAAASRVHEHNRLARFLFAGYEGDPGPFRAKAEAAGIGDVMVFLGRLPHDHFALALRASDVFISVPSVDATAVSLLEALACGCAVIVSDLPSATEWVQNEVSGLVVTPRDINGLTRAMLRFAAETEFRRQCGKAAVATARQYAGFEQNMDWVDQIFSSLVSGVDRWPQEVSLPHIRQSGANE
jgi:glycosyltransferase involved in cell wall biosynthesis